MQNQRLTYG